MKISVLPPRYRASLHVFTILNTNVDAMLKTYTSHISTLIVGYFNEPKCGSRNIGRREPDHKCISREISDQTEIGNFGDARFILLRTHVT